MLEDVLIDFWELRLHIHKICTAEGHKLAVLNCAHSEHTAPLRIAKFFLTLTISSPLLSSVLGAIVLLIE